MDAVEEEKGNQRIPASSPALKIFEILVQLIKAIVWPLLVIVVTFTFREPVTYLFQHSGQASLTLPGGFAVNITQIAASAAAAGVAVGKQSAERGQPVTEAAVQNIAQVFTPSGQAGQRSLSEGMILWVDDNPSNNISLINAFQSLGVRVFQATSTEEAQQMLAERGRYDVIISDMDRPPDAEAGKTLLSFLASKNDRTPVIIYAGRWAAEHQGEEQAIGVTKITNDPSVVYHLALRIIQRDAQSGGR